MAATNPRVSWTVQNKVLYIGVESRGREHRWKLSASSPDKAAILREIADVLDPPERPRRRAPRVVEHYGDDYYEDDDEEDDPAPRRRAPRRAQESRTQVRTPYPPLDPQGVFSGDAGDPVDFFDHSRGYTPDGQAIRTPVPRDPAERASMARLSQEAFEKGQAHAGAVAGQDPEVNNLPIIEARPKAVRRQQPLDSQGRGFLPAPPSDTPGLRGEVQVRKRPKIEDPHFYYKDTN